jgi:hypothetical protein
MGHALGPFCNMRSLYITFVALGDEDAVRPPLPLLRAELLDSVTHQWLDLELTTSSATSAA